MSDGGRFAAVLLDTCAVIWLATGEPLRGEANATIVAAAKEGGVFVSAVSAWEIGLLSRPGRRGGYTFLPDPVAWFARFMAGPGMTPAPFNARIAIKASRLSGAFHADPADRMLISTAISLSIPLVTRDDKILAYAAAGHLEAVRC